ncbi:MAG: beta-galactosidase GalA [Prevotella sp.]
MMKKPKHNSKTIPLVRLIGLVLLGVALLSNPVHAQREQICFDLGWRFHFGHAGDPVKDFGCGTEYFNYLTKAASIHNEGPYSMKFDDSSWQPVDLPHDFVVQLPFSREGSHSHGYKTVGYRYPETSVGWYRKTFFIPKDDEGKHIALLFDGIFRDSRIWVNGFYCGRDESGYLSQYHDISEYINYGEENVVCVRADATLEEGWFYEGGGIYRHVWLEKTSPLHIANDGLWITLVRWNRKQNYAVLKINALLDNAGNKPAKCRIHYTLTDAEGQKVMEYEDKTYHKVNARDMMRYNYGLRVNEPKMWSPAQPYLYTLTARVTDDKGGTIDTKSVKVGIREVVFDKDSGLILNGQPLKIKGVNMHQDHAGVGVALPDDVIAYRIKKLKDMGCNTYRASHNPSSQALLDMCDSLGMMVVEENRLSGISEYQKNQLRRTIERARQHPSVILWSVGNEEWGIEWNPKGEKIAEAMREWCHRFDLSREMSFATSGGPTVEVPVDVAGYNYIMQNPVEKHRKKYPGRKCYGSEETTGCGTRDIYYDDPEGRWMPALNRMADEKDSCYNRIERGWRFYAERPWAAGCCFWTGFDYRGEPNPLKYPATGSEFGILDYCGFPKDEAYYLKAWWTDEDVLHILPHWNLHGHEGEKVKIWAYSNCDEVELWLNGKSLGKKTMPRYGHIEWEATYTPGKLRAIGWRQGRRITTSVETAGEVAQATAETSAQELDASRRGVAVIDITLRDRKGRRVPDACGNIIVKVEGEAEILGFGNGDPAFRSAEQPSAQERQQVTVPAFNGHAQVLVQAKGQQGNATVTITPELPAASQKKNTSASLSLSIR